MTVEEPNGEITTNTWDFENRLVQIEHPDDTITTCAYNADSLKVEQDDGVDVQRLIYDGANVLQEQDDLGLVEAEFTYVPQPHAHVVSQYRDTESSFYHLDGIHDVTKVTDPSQVITDEYFYTAWGELRSCFQN